MLAHVEFENGRDEHIGYDSTLIFTSVTNPKEKLGRFKFQFLDNNDWIIDPDAFEKFINSCRKSLITRTEKATIEVEWNYSSYCLNLNGENVEFFVNNNGFECSFFIKNNEGLIIGLKKVLNELKRTIAIIG